MQQFLDDINNIKTALQLTLPGAEAQFLMAPSGRKEMNYAGTLEKAAVMLLLYPINNEINIIFIKRPEYNGAHSNQISFPGGRIEKNDFDLQATATRETQEELGNKLDGIEMIGKLTPLPIPISGFEVYPYVGALTHFPIWQPDPEEVSYILEVPIYKLFDENYKKKETKYFNGIEREVPFYDVNSEKIWGATAMILSEFETILNKICYR